MSKLQRDLDRLQEWVRNWQLKFNSDKCKVLHLGRTNQQKSYYMSTNTGVSLELQGTELEKDLGVWIGPSLTFSSHCETQSGKANRTLGLIRRTYTYKSGQNKSNKTVYSRTPPYGHACITVSACITAR